jgi:pimeloyl-ACP methyl ester carboxylesterase
MSLQANQNKLSSFRRFSSSRPGISYLDIPARAGREEALPLLLLHGVGSSADTWSELLPLLDGRRVVAPDYRGHGASEIAPPPYAMDDFVDDAFRLLDEVKIETVHVAGFSIGALFAERMAILRPKRVATLVLLNSIAARTPEQKERATARHQLISSTPPAGLAAGSAVRWFTPAFREARPDLVRGEVDIVSAIAHAPYASSYGVLVENDLIDAVGAIACPTLIITGELDEGSTPAMSQALAARIAGSKLVIVPGVKHYIHIERPAAIASEMNAFLAVREPVAEEAGPTAAKRR